jgi:hypothetical protein
MYTRIICGVVRMLVMILYQNPFQAQKAIGTAHLQKIGQLGG